LKLRIIFITELSLHTASISRRDAYSLQGPCGPHVFTTLEKQAASTIYAASTNCRGCFSSVINTCGPQGLQMDKVRQGSPQQVCRIQV